MNDSNPIIQYAVEYPLYRGGHHISPPMPLMTCERMFEEFSKSGQKVRILQRQIPPWQEYKAPTT